MSDVKSFVFPEGGTFGGNNTTDFLLGSMLGNGGGFGGGMNNPFWAIILLAFLRNWGGFNGENGNSQLTAIQEQLNTNHGQTLLMDAIKGNASAVHELATTIGCNHNAVQTAINGVQSAICGVGNQVGMSSAQVINSIQAGNTAIANQIAQCCCDNKLLMTQQNYENRINNIEQTNVINKGFGDIAYATQAQTTALAANQDANTRSVLQKIDAVQDEAKNNEIASLRAALTAANSRAERAAELAPIYQALNDIKCKQPETVTIPNSPGVLVPNCVAWNAGLYGGYGYPFGQKSGQIWS